MNNPIRILLQTTIPFTENDWHIGSLLKETLEGMRDELGQPLCRVTARNREDDDNGNDIVLSKLDQTDFDELWLFAVDVGDGLTKEDCAAITSFRKRGGGLMVTRDHQDLGSSVCTIGGVGRAHHFHSTNCEPNESRHCRDDKETTNITWPNYHSGSNGDYQTITPTEPPHSLILRHDSTFIEYFPAHPHEGAVSVPEGANARVIATGKSQSTDRAFNLAVAFEREPDQQGNTLGRGVAESSFHHFVDYNWDVSMSCPSFLEEPPGDGYKKNPRALEDIKTYVRNLALWLKPES